MELSQLFEMLSELVSTSDDILEANANALLFKFRDIRLELIRQQAGLSEQQYHRLRQVEARLDMVVTGHGLASGIRPEAQKALIAFDWLVK